LKYLKNKDNTTQTESNILFEELYNQIISKNRNIIYFTKERARSGIIKIKYYNL
jgi:hypothetical protein